MRTLTGGAMTVIVAGLAIGCVESTHRSAATRPAKPIVATVVLKVPGMT
jgi:hypothetical protein